MTLKPLILGILGVVVFTTGSYFLVSPYIENMAGRGDIENTDVDVVTDVYEEESLSEVQDDDIAEVSNFELDEEDSSEVITGVPAQLESVPVKVVTPMPPVPAATITPEPTIPPVSTPSGYTLSVVATHNSKTSCWTAVNGSVYDITPYVPKHPGGERNILKICGKDGTSAFEGQHGGESKPENILAKYRIGALI